MTQVIAGFEASPSWRGWWPMLNAVAITALVAFWLDRGLLHPHLASDGAAYWSVRDGVLYEYPWLAELDGLPHPYVYSPAFAWLLWPLVQLPLPLFMAVLVAAQTALVAWLAGPVLAAILVWTFYPLWATNLWAGSIYPLLAAALAIAPRFPATWSVLLLTKVTPGLGVLWHAGRREWRSLAVALGTTLAIVASSFAINPANWFAWGELLADGSQRAAGPGAVPIPLALRLPAAGALALLAGLRGWRHLLPLSVMLAMPQLGWSATPLLLASVYWWRTDHPVARGRTGSGEMAGTQRAQHRPPGIIGPQEESTIARHAMRIAILGTRGIPGNYGGFETFAEELSARLVERGHDLTVYCRIGNSPGRPGKHRGVELVHLPALRNKYAETLTHTLYSAVHALFRRYDIVYVCNSANAPICWIPWARRQRPILNVDGLEWQRAKWGPVAKRYYRWATSQAARMPIEVVTDAEVIQTFYREQLHRETKCIPYGTDLYDRGHGAERLADMDLEPDRYLLYVSRMEPENNALLVVQAYAQVETDIPLVMVGDAPYARDYIDEVKAAADSRVRFPGYRFGEDYHALQGNALVYVQATEVGGTHPALVEALGHRNAVIAHDVPEHREVVGEAGVYFGHQDGADLAARMRELIDSPAEVERLRHLAGERVQRRYTWEAVTDQYEAYFRELLDR